MARVKNVGGGPDDEDPRSPPRQPIDAKGKATKKLATKKRKYPDVDTTRAAAERVEAGGARSGVQIADQLSPAQRTAIEQVECCHGSRAGTVILEGRRVAFEGDSASVGATVADRADTGGRGDRAGTLASPL